MNPFPMKTIRLKAATRGFTLIELLVVISIIAILAGLLLTAGVGVQRNAAKKRAKAELVMVANAIDSYKSKLGYYPPDNAGSYWRNTLFYELVGCTRVNIGANSTFTPLDGSPVVTSGALNTFTGGRVAGIQNSSASSSSSDEGRTAQTILKELKLTQYADSGGIRLLGIALDGPVMAGTVTPFYYNSSNPTNNPNSYDLWVDIRVGGKTNRISNWSAGPQQL
jgi:prepilin-type N-terminal cleavage/methylation domain-containing protein